MTQRRQRPYYYRNLLFTPGVSFWIVQSQVSEPTRRRALRKQARQKQALRPGTARDEDFWLIRAKKALQIDGQGRVTSSRGPTEDNGIVNSNPNVLENAITFFGV